MSDFIQTDTFRIIAVTVMIISGAYLVGRAFTKGFLKEIDAYLDKKFADYINNKKRKENDNKETE